MSTEVLSTSTRHQVTQSSMFHIPQMSTLPFDIISQIINTVGESEDTNLLKDLSLVSHCFHQICSKHLFATVELHDVVPRHHAASSKKGFLKLLKRRPDVVNHIRKLTYEVGNKYDDRPLLLQLLPTHHESDDYLLSPILPIILRTIPRLTCLTINALNMDWNEINPSLTAAFLHLMRLPTINHIDLSFIRNFPMSILTSCVNLLRLHISNLSNIDPLEVDIVVQSEMMPKIREFHTSDSPEPTAKLLHAKRQDNGRPAFNFRDLRRLSTCLEDKQNVWYLLQNAKLLEKLHLTLGYGQNLIGIHDILSHSARTLKSLNLTLVLYEEYDGTVNLPFGGLCQELEAMAGHNMLEVLSLEVELLRDETADDLGSMFQNVEKVLMKPGWSALRQVSFKIMIVMGNHVGFSEALQSLPDKYLTHLSKHESVALNFSSCVAV